LRATRERQLFGVRRLDAALVCRDLSRPLLPSSALTRGRQAASAQEASSRLGPKRRRAAALQTLVRILMAQTSERQCSQRQTKVA
jgi:hypothetical protein